MRRPETCDLFKSQILGDVRASAFKTAIRFINYELVEGDICEFGCYTGRSLSAFAYFQSQYVVNENQHNSKNLPQRKIYGFDSFEGLPESEGHPRWDKGLFSNNHSFHPVFSQNEIITPRKIEDYFQIYGLDKPIIKKSYFENLNLNFINKIAIAHIDCDLYSSTKTTLNLIKPKLVQGSILLFDDWFHFSGQKNKGEQKAFYEFIDENKNYVFEEFLRYGTFCKAFIVHIN